MYDDLFDTLLSLMEPLARVQQDRRHHPEGDALFHSLQVFDLALAAGEPPHLVAAALFHDVGKAMDGAHEVIGAAALASIADERTCWLVGRHMDLLRDPSGARAALCDDPRLDELERLRVYDVGGRRPSACVTSCERALGTLLEPGVAEEWLDPAHWASDAER